MSKEGKWILSGLCLCIIIALVVPSENENTPTTFANEEKVAATKTDADERNKNKNLEIKGLRIASEDIDIRNPFTYTHETRDGKISYNDASNKNALTTTKSLSMNDTSKINAPQAKRASRWKLEGIIIGGTNKIAILSDENESKPLQIGDTFGDNVVTAIEQDYIVYSNGQEEGRLWLST